MPVRFRTKGENDLLLNKLVRPEQAIAVDLILHPERANIVQGRITALILEDHVDLRPGPCVLFDAVRSPWVIRVEIDSVEHAHFATLTQEDLEAAGCTMPQELAKYLPGSLDAARRVTIVRWDKISGHFVDKAEEFSVDPESVYEQINCG